MIIHNIIHKKNLFCTSWENKKFWIIYELLFGGYSWYQPLIEICSLIASYTWQSLSESENPIQSENRFLSDSRSENRNDQVRSKIVPKLIDPIRSETPLIRLQLIRWKPKFQILKSILTWICGTPFFRFFTGLNLWSRGVVQKDPINKYRFGS